MIVASLLSLTGIKILTPPGILHGHCCKTNIVRRTLPPIIERLLQLYGLKWIKFLGKKKILGDKNVCQINTFKILCQDEVFVLLKSMPANAFTGLTS